MKLESSSYFFGFSLINNDGDSSEPKKVEFIPHCTGETQGAMHDTVKKQITHNIRSECKFGIDPAESIKKNLQHKSKEDSWKHLGSKEVSIVNSAKPTKLELVDHMEFMKERNE